MTESERAAKRFRREHRTKEKPQMDRELSAFQSHAEQDGIRHFGTVIDSGHVISTRRNPGEKIQDLGMRGPRTLPEIQKACRSIQGQPFKRLPGNLPEDSIAGIIEGGFMVPVVGVEMVWNDRDTINKIHGPGVYEEIVAGTVEEKILELARSLYQPERIQ